MKRDLTLIAVSMFAWGLGEGMFLYFQPIYLQQMGADAIAIGTILGGFGLAMTVSHIPAGYLADRFGRKPILLSAWLFGLAATWVMALASNLAVFVAGMLLYGITMFVMSPLQSYLAAARENLSVGRVLTLISASYNLGAVIGPWLGGRVGEQVGIRQTYYIAGSIFVLSTLVILFIRPQPVERIPQEGAERRWYKSYRYLIFLGIIFVSIFSMYLPVPLSPNFLTNQAGLSLSRVGMLYSLFSLGVVSLNLILGAIPARAGFLMAQLAVGVFALLMWRGEGFPWYALGYLLLGGYKTARSLGSALMRELAPSSQMGLAFGISETVASLAVIGAPVAAGFLYARNPLMMYIVSIILILLSILLSAIFSPRPLPEECLRGDPLNPALLKVEEEQASRLDVMVEPPGG